MANEFSGHVPVKSRHLSIDCMRGMAMCLIILFHAQGLLATSLSPASEFAILRIGNFGTPAFTYISGLMLGYFLYYKGRRLEVIQKYVRRGVLLLAAIHFLNAVGVYPYYSKYYSFGDTLFYRWFITDTIGVILIATPLLSALTPMSRLVVGIAMLVLWKPLGLIPNIQSNGMLIVREVLFGINEEGPHILEFISPLIPISGIFLVGSFVGDRFARALQDNALRRFVRKLAWATVTLSCICFALLGLWLALKSHSLGLTNDALKHLLYPHRYYSLLPLYLAMSMGSFALIVYRIEIKKINGAVDEWVAVFGRTSLFTYVAQYYVIQGMPSLAGWARSLSFLEWLLFVTSGFMVLHALARLYSAAFKGKTGRPRPRNVRPEHVVSPPSVV